MAEFRKSAKVRNRSEHEILPFRKSADLAKVEEKHKMLNR
jgi:hypothetical protein